MYCSSCGSAVKPNLAFCNRCGAKLKNPNSEPAKRNEASADTLVGAIVGVFAIGMGTTIGLMAVMKNVLDFNSGMIAGYSTVSFALMIVLELVFILMLLGRNRAVRVEEGKDQLRAQFFAELNAPPVRVPGEPAESVTSHTTKSFQKVVE